eukprot:GILJ01008627.1.p1 GENE.GILJ01008627.1~~GILJ01008627.1.p1  ORF type:complete len:379 (-),score=48.22 GILJ01008627.1:148-1176(-)
MGFRAFSTSFRSKQATYSRHGNPQEVLSMQEEEISQPEASQVVVKMLASPMNPSDFNMVEGVYDLLPELPAVGGNEGVGVVVAKGSAVQHLQIHDWVIPNKPTLGTWRTYAKAEESQFLRVSSDIPVEYAATLSVNPCSAYRMLTDFENLQPGDVVIQNGANSTVGQAVIQIARDRNIKTINIVRNRPNIEALTAELKDLGADAVITDEVASTPAIKDVIKEIGQPKLGLNCVGGQSSAELARLLKFGGSLVTYGGMSRRPVTIPTGLLIFKDIKVRGFWMSRWLSEHSEQERGVMLHDIVTMVKEGKFRLLLEQYDYTDFDAALKRAREPMRNGKVVLMMR